jgi:hypothetical protein
MRGRRCSRVVLVVALTVLAAAAFAQVADIEVVRDDPALTTAQTMFRERWRVGDSASLANLVAERGALISLARDDRSARTTTPSRARYLFKTLFLATHDHVLETLVVSAGATGDVEHVVLDWSYRRGGVRQSDRLFVTWMREPEGWRLAELRTGR